MKDIFEDTNLRGLCEVTKSDMFYVKHKLKKKQLILLGRNPLLS